MEDVVINLAFGLLLIILIGKTFNGKGITAIHHDKFWFLLWLLLI